jgi:hypothetical protein
MDERERRRVTDPADEEVEAARDQGALGAVTEAQIHAHASSAGTSEEALRAQEEEAALDHGSVDRIDRPTSIGGEAERELVSQQEEAALDHGSVDRIATHRMSGRTPARRRAAHRRGSQA